ncbi:MAG: hypothetical protein JWO83_5004 [Caulobacteraceae bacterium]|nr:hypothetical protein [Caulobacteraceae bacterium]
MDIGFDYAAHGLRPSRRPPIPGGRATIAALLAAAREACPDRVALVGRSGRLSYEQLAAVVDRAAWALSAAGIGRFDRVAGSLPNDVDLVIAFLATLRMGAIWVGLPRVLSLPEKRFILEDAGVSLLLAERGVAAQLRTSSETPILAEIWAGDPGDASSDWSRRLQAAPDRPFVAAPIDPHAPAAIAYTSGTTGFPKGAVHSQHNLLTPGAVLAATGDFGPRDTTGVVLPLTIPNLMVVGPLALFQAGGRCVAIDRTDPVGLAEWIGREQINHMTAVPTLYHDLLSRMDLAESLRSLTRPEVGGADMPETLRRLFRERFGREVQVAYGLTEAPSRVTWHQDDRAVPDACGKACPHLAISIQDDRGRAAAAGDVGEIWVGPRDEGPFKDVYTPFLGYWRAPEATARTLRDGWLDTGDLGCVDAAGNLFIRGRRKELILRGGANVYPAEVERVLCEDPRVAACAVIGTPDVRLGQQVVAFVQFTPGASAAADELRTLCEANLARYKIPVAFHVVDAFPRNVMGKIVKPKLAELLLGVT